MVWLRRCRPGLLMVAAVGLAGWSCQSSPQDTPPRPRIAWTFEPVARGAIVAAPLVAGARVYAAAVQDHGFHPSGMVYCLEAATGKVLWQFDDDGAMLHTVSSPRLWDDRLYLGEGMHANLTCKLYCLDAATGRKHWDFLTGGHIESTPCVADGKVYFGSGDDGLYCLDALTGKLRWHFQGPYHTDTSPAVLGKHVYGGSGVSLLHRRTEVWCLDTDQGQVVWRTPTDLPVWGVPRAEGKDLFIGLGNGRLNRSAQPPERPAGALLSLEVEGGRQRWRFDVADAVMAQPEVDGHRVHFAARDGFCYGLERVSGALIWKQNLGSPTVTHPTLADGRLYVAASAGQVHCLEAATGKVVWILDVAAQTHMQAQLLSSPAVVKRGAGGHDIYFGAELKNPAGSAAVLYCVRD